MLWLNYYLYLYDLEESQRNKEILVIVAILSILLIIAAGIEILKDKYLHKVKNKRIRDFIRKI